MSKLKQAARQNAELCENTVCCPDNQSVADFEAGAAWQRERDARFVEMRLSIYSCTKDAHGLPEAIRATAFDETEKKT